MGNKEIYKQVITDLIVYFDKLYKDCYFKKLTDPKLDTVQQINNGDCYVMALLIDLICKKYGCEPVINAGPAHVFIIENKTIYDANFPEGISLDEIKDHHLNCNISDDDLESLLFYYGQPLRLYENLVGYFDNEPYLSLFVEYVLSEYNLKTPIGLRKYLNCNKVRDKVNTRSNTFIWVRRYRQVSTHCYAMKRFINKLRKERGK